MRILIVDNYIEKRCHGAEDLRRFARKVTGATIQVRRAPDSDLPPSAAPYDAIILSGSLTSAMDSSPWVLKLESFVREAVNLNKHYLGICYGHQLLARALGGKVRKGNSPEYGWSRIKVRKSNPLLKGLPEEFYSFSSHQDEVFALPTGFEHLASSKLCEIQAMALPGKPVYGIQFHPERNLEECVTSLKETAKKNPKAPLLDAKDSTSRFSEDVGAQIFCNFFNEVRS